MNVTLLYFGDCPRWKVADGADPFADPAGPVGLSCRMYRTPHGPAGSPTLDQLRSFLAPSNE